ncbi:MAG: chromate resistance protein [Armatimonadota bacterium]|nr:chromate resistance protein [Armatimonadota bacterium]MDR7465656.1 chromate resistance protein [Armatimonadota bacterium]MDR7499531.1 chromate resistance protein [Armatimonadota bacterium]MDR7503492.1 chromate resistance protein [Armatimonadota bacterium]MDR7548152.1 chromate resistance protein [Armatimonadota bacterium]
MKWVTRRNAKVDRIACPWLIRRFIDPAAEFLYVAPDEVEQAAAHEGATVFDVAGAELGHVEGRCSFESILRKYDLRDPGLLLLGRIVHGADIPQDIALEPEAAGLRAVAHGFATLYGDRDHEKLEAQMPVYDALYAWCRERVNARA